MASTNASAVAVASREPTPGAPGADSALAIAKSKAPLVTSARAFSPHECRYNELQRLRTAYPSEVKQTLKHEQKSYSCNGKTLLQADASHIGLVRSRNAFTTTEIELSDIAAAASIGLSSHPNSG